MGFVDIGTDPEISATTITGACGEVLAFFKALFLALTDIEYLGPEIVCFEIAIFL